MEEHLKAVAEKMMEKYAKFPPSWRQHIYMKPPGTDVVARIVAVRTPNTTYPDIRERLGIGLDDECLIASWVKAKSLFQRGSSPQTYMGRDAVFNWRLIGVSQQYSKLNPREYGSFPEKFDFIKVIYTEAEHFIYQETERGWVSGIKVKII